MTADMVRDLCEKARSATRHRHLPEAIRLYEQALAQAPDDPAIHEGLATTACLAQDYDRAIAGFLRVTQLKPRDARAWVNLGALYNLQENYRQAVDALRKGLQRDSHSADAYYNLGIAQRHLNQPQLAISAYRECIRLKPDMLEAHLNLANLFAEQNNFKSAITHYETILRLQPAHASATKGLAHVQHLLSQNRVEASPFGRLVDTSRLVAKGAAEEESQHLTAEERFDDRQMIQLSCAESGEMAAALWRHLKEHLEPRLLTVNRILALDPENRRGLLDAQELFHDAVTLSETLFQNWLAEFRRLRDHEDRMKHCRDS